MLTAQLIKIRNVGDEQRSRRMILLQLETTLRAVIIYNRNIVTLIRPLTTLKFWARRFHDSRTAAISQMGLDYVNICPFCWRNDDCLTDADHGCLSPYGHHVWQSAMTQDTATKSLSDIDLAVYLAGRNSCSNFASVVYTSGWPVWGSSLFDFAAVDIRIHCAHKNILILSLICHSRWLLVCFACEASRWGLTHYLCILLFSISNKLLNSSREKKIW